eukprot:SAG22_NODE_623_length_8459_cov_39.989474_2_plen_394_part_00
MSPLNSGVRADGGATGPWGDDILADARWAVDAGADFIFASGIRSANDVDTLRQHMLNPDGLPANDGGGDGDGGDSDGEDGGKPPATVMSGHDIQVLAKIENVDAVRDIDEILRVSDGVVLCKAELEADLLCIEAAHAPGFHAAACKVAMAQKLVIAKANLAGKPVALGSPLLPTYSTRGRPSATSATPLSESGAVWAVEAAANGPCQAEQAEIVNCVLDGVDSFVLTAETTTGLRPPAAVHWLHGCIAEAETIVDHFGGYNLVKDATSLPLSPNEAVAAAAVSAAHDQEAALIIVVTYTGIAGRFVSKYRPKVPVLLVTESHRICRQAYLSRGLIPMVGRLTGQDVDTTLKDAVGLAETVDYCRKGQLVVAVYELDSDAASGCGANMRVLRVT